MVVFNWLTMMIVPMICIKIISPLIMLSQTFMSMGGDRETISSLLDLIHSRVIRSKVMRLAGENRASNA
jgi:hypothetical protein